MSLIGKNGGGSINVPDSLRFANTAERDDYFLLNPSRLRADTYVTVAGTLQRYNGTDWENTSVVIEGEAGTPAPPLQLQYSTDGTTGWSATINTAIHKYWRWSTDNGVTWSPDAVKYSADGTGMTPQQEQDLVDNTAARHAHANKAILDATTGTFTLARQNKLDGVQDTWKGVFTNFAEINTAFPTPTDGWACWNTETATVWNASSGAWSNTGATSTGDMLKATYDPQGIAGDAFDRANHTGEQAISTVTGLQTELDKLPAMQNEIDAIELRLDDPATGLVKAITDLDAQINAAGTGLEDRVTELEAGGTATMKFRTHIESGVYVDGEIIQRNNKLYRANSAIDGSVTAVPFVEGTAPSQWTEISQQPKGTALRAAEFDASGNVIASTTKASELHMLNGVTSAIQGQINAKVTKGWGTNPGSDAVAVISSTGELSFGSLSFTDLTSKITPLSGSTLTASRVVCTNGSSQFSTPTNVTPTELSYLSGVTSAIQTQLAGKTFIGYVAKPTDNDRVALVTLAGSVNWTDVTKTEIDRVKGVTSKIQDQIDAKLTAPDHASMSTYGSSNGLRIKTTQPNIVFSTSGTDECYISGGGHFRPFAAGQNIGENSVNGRWGILYISGGVNNSSDEELKTNIAEIPDALLDVWFDYVQPLRYEFIANQGKRSNFISVGMIAQDVISAFDAVGLDWHQWDVVSEGADFDDWDDEPLHGRKDDYYSLNYAACQLIEMAAIRKMLGIKKSRRFS